MWLCWWGIKLPLNVHFWIEDLQAHMAYVIGSTLLPASTSLIHTGPGGCYVTSSEEVQEDIIRIFVNGVGLWWVYWRQVLWLSNVDKAKGYTIDFLSVSLHAISRDPEAYPSPWNYAQVLQCFNLFLRPLVFRPLIEFLIMKSVSGVLEFRAFAGFLGAW